MNNIYEISDKIMAWINTHFAQVMIGLGTIFSIAIFMSPTMVKWSDTEITLRQNALFRLYNIDIACYDIKLDWWFIHTVSTTDQPAHWVYEWDRRLEFITLANGTVSLISDDDIFINQINIDKIDLKCKSWAVK